MEKELNRKLFENCSPIKLEHSFNRDSLPNNKTEEKKEDLIEGEYSMDDNSQIIENILNTIRNIRSAFFKDQHLENADPTLDPNFSPKKLHFHNRDSPHKNQSPSNKFSNNLHLSSIATPPRSIQRSPPKNFVHYSPNKRLEKSKPLKLDSPQNDKVSPIKNQSLTRKNTNYKKANNDKSLFHKTLNKENFVIGEIDPYQSSNQSTRKILSPNNTSHIKKSPSKKEPSYLNNQSNIPTILY